MDIFFWWSVVSTILAVCFLGWDIWQFASSIKDKDILLKEKELHKAQVKIWDNFANAVSVNLIALSDALLKGRIKTMSHEEIGEVIKGVQFSAGALKNSLNEERLFSDEEVKQRQVENAKKFDELQSVSKSPSK